MLRSKHGPYLTKGEAQRLINTATKMLVASVSSFLICAILFQTYFVILKFHTQRYYIVNINRIELILYSIYYSELHGNQAIL